MADPKGRSKKIITGYELTAAKLIASYSALSPDTVLSPVAAFPPAAGQNLLDAGASPSVIAGWLALGAPGLSG